MRQFHITGMGCAACSARVEKAASSVTGVKSCAVNLLTNTLTVEGTASDKDIVKAVEDAGYGVEDEEAQPEREEETSENKEINHLKVRLRSSLCFLIPLMYVSMGHMMWHWPLPDFLTEHTVWLGWIQFILTFVIIIINRKFFISGFQSFLHKAPNMDTLVALGAGAAFVYSTATLLVTADMHGLYFESAAMILTLITVGKMLEAHSKGKTTDALKGLMKLAPETACVIRNEQEIIVSVKEVNIGDIFVVRPGENIPVDGVVLKGESAVNEAALTGESIPVDKTVGDMISAATLNQSGFLTCEATRVGKDTTLSKIIQMVSDASATKAPIAKIADKVSGIFVPIVLMIALVTFGGWLLAGKTFGFAIARAISVLVISCPCALGLATPVAIMVGNGVGAKNGILFKTAVSLEETGRVKTVVLDKTGTITTGKPTVTDVFPANDLDENALLALAYSLETKSEHPLAKAVVEKATELGLKAKETMSFAAVLGNGLKAVCEGKILAGGNKAFIQEMCDIPQEAVAVAESFAQNGKTVLFFCSDNVFIGLIAVADNMKEEAPKAILELKKMGIRVVMLSGDQTKTAEAIGRQAGVDEVIAEVLPDGKEAVIRNLMQTGKVAMVGDGMNDAPALSRANVGIAIGAGTDIAIDAADIVLMKSNLLDVPAAIRLSRFTLRNIHQNLFWAFAYNIIGIPLAAGVLGLALNPMFGAAAMSLSSFCVVSNALRLNFCKLHERIM